VPPRPRDDDAGEELARWDHAHLWHPFTQMRQWLSEDPLIIERGEGNYLVDREGRRYLDGVSSLWCNVHGHNRAEINAAVAEQLSRIAHSTMLGLTNAAAVRLAKRLVEIVPRGLTRVFYSDSGATAVEVALKMAFQYWRLKGDERRTRFVSLVEAYHGDTLGAMSVGYSECFHHFYRPLLFDCLRLRPPHLFRFRDRLSDEQALARALQEARQVIGRHGREIAAVVIEPLMQGAAGMWAQPPATCVPSASSPAKAAPCSSATRSPRASGARGGCSPVSMRE
jgi:adenosylmethionine-8-amino-7-oxononanoate aminotransferase